MNKPVGRVASWLVSSSLVVFTSRTARAAEDASPAATTDAAPTGTAAARRPSADSKPAETPPTWLGSITFSAQVEAGIIVNPDRHRPSNGLNFGQLFTEPIRW